MGCNAVGRYSKYPLIGRYKGESDGDPGAYMARLVIVLAFIGLSYWYWTGPYQNSAKTPPVDNPKKNARIMAQCMAGEKFAEADGYRSPGEHAEEVCADENGLIKMYGEWHHR